MTITLFISILTFGSVENVLLTEAIKKAYENAGKEYSANVVALVDAAVIGGLGTAATYMLMNIPWTINNILCLAIMIVTVWVGSMVGYDKVIQLVKQISEITPKNKDVEDKKED